MSQRGQATVEYVGLIALVAALLVTGGLMAFGPALTERVVEGFRRALCAVTGAACEPGREPCVVASEEVRDRGEVTALAVRVGRDHAVLRERRSDGSVLVTVIDGVDAGVQGALGLEGTLRAGRRRLAVGRALRGALIAEGGGGRTWLARDAREADAIVAAIGSDGRLRWLTAPYRAVGGLGLREEPEAAEVYLQGGVRAKGDGELSLPGLDAQLHAVVAGAGGVRWNRHSGEATFYLTRSGELAGQLASGLGDVAGGVRGEGRLALTLDRRGRPLRLSALGAYERPDGRDRGRRTELEATLDLRDPAHAAAVRALLPGLATGRTGRGVALYGLLALLRAEGRTDRRVYATARDEAGLGGRLTAVGTLGAQALRSATGTRLLDAASRGPGGPWLRRDDCLAGR